MDMIEHKGKLRARLREQFLAALGADPVCRGRVATTTIDWLADEAIRACDVVERRTRDKLSSVHASEPPHA